MANPLSAMMTSIALTTGTPSAPLPPVFLPADYETRLAAVYDLSGRRTVTRGISVSDGRPKTNRGTTDEGITMAVCERMAAEILAHAADQSRAAYRSVASNVLRYLGLANNWDNDQGVAPQMGTARNALAFLRQVISYARAPRPFVVGDGEIGFSWESAGGYAQVGFHSDDEIVVIARSADGEHDVRGVYDGLAAVPLAQLKEIICSL